MSVGRGRAVLKFGCRRCGSWVENRFRRAGRNEGGVDCGYVGNVEVVTKEQMHNQRWDVRDFETHFKSGVRHTPTETPQTPDRLRAS